jgi:hypothetical protein
VDPESMPFLGYLPQDMLGRSVFEFYHPEDLPFIQDIYQTGEADNHNRYLISMRLFKSF